MGGWVVVVVIYSYLFINGRYHSFHYYDYYYSYSSPSSSQYIKYLIGPCWA